MDVLAGLLTTVAPGIASVLLGPAGGMAVKFMAEKLLGNPSASVEQVITAVKAAPPEKLMDLNRMYEAETARLSNEQGRVDPDTLALLNDKTRSKVALMRMITRPLVVRRMSQYLMAPLYLMGVDGFLAFINTWVVFLSDEKNPKQLAYLAATFFDGESVYTTMYTAGVAPAATIVVSYMTLRQIEKSGNPFSGLGAGISKLFGK